jgi:hypothetical protein
MWMEAEIRGTMTQRGEERMKWAQMSVLLMVLAGVACSLGQVDPRFLIPSERKGKVREAAEAYAGDLRWGRIEQAARLVHPRARPAFLRTLSGPSHALRFTHFEVESVELAPERDQANARVSFGLYRPPSLEEQRIVEQQVWHYEPDARAWYLEPDLPLYLGEVGAAAP